MQRAFLKVDRAIKHVRERRTRAIDTTDLRGMAIKRSLDCKAKQAGRVYSEDRILDLEISKSTLKPRIRKGLVGGTYQN
jgi:hypothetical protein